MLTPTPIHLTPCHRSAAFPDRLRRSGAQGRFARRGHDGRSSLDRIPFAQLVRDVFPDAEHVIDRLHVVQPVNDAIEDFRLDLAKAEERKLGIRRRSSVTWSAY